MKVIGNAVAEIINYNQAMDNLLGSFNLRAQPLAPNIIEQLKEVGFAIIPDVIAASDLTELAEAYDLACRCASLADKKIGSTSIRVNNFVNCGPLFDALYINPALLEASHQIISRPFKLSSLHARTLLSNSQAQKLHVDFKPDEERFPLIGFILMVNEFRADNGATRFIPGSHKWEAVPSELIAEVLADYEVQSQFATGGAGSMIIFNGSVWHGHGANVSSEPRRSVQGAFIPRSADSGTDFSACVRPETLKRISPLAKYLLAL